MNNSHITKPISVLIPDGDTNNAVAVVRCLGESKNSKIFVLSKDEDKPVRYSRYISKYIYIPRGESKQEQLAAIVKAIKQTNADVLLPIHIETIRLVSEYKEQLSELISIAPVPEVGSFDIADDKHLLSLWLQENNIPHPKTIFFDKNRDLDEVVSSIKFPIIVKPTIGFGGTGIEIIENSNELQLWHNRIDQSGDYIFQSYIKGYDIDCSVISVEGKIHVHTIQKSIKNNEDDTWAIAMEFLQDEAVYSVVQEVIEKFNWSGVVNIGLRYDKETNQINLIEMNPRFWASVSASIFAGANFPYYSCLLGLGQELPEITYTNKIVIRTSPAFKMIMRKVLLRTYQKFDNTYLELNIKDPVPTFMKEFYKYSIKLRRNGSVTSVNLWTSLTNRFSSLVNLGQR